MWDGANAKGQFNARAHGYPAFGKRLANNRNIACQSKVSLAGQFGLYKREGYLFSGAGFQGKAGGVDGKTFRKIIRVYFKHLDIRSRVGDN